MKCDKSFLRNKMVAWRMAYLAGDLGHMESIANAVATHGYADSTVAKWLREQREWSQAQYVKAMAK